MAPSFRWIKNPATLSLVRREQPARIAALARLTGVGWLAYSLIQRQGRLSLLTHDQQVPGNNGTTAPPTAAVGLALFAQVALVQCRIGDQESAQVSGLQLQHLLICDARGLDHAWYEAPSEQKTNQFNQQP